MPVNDLIRFSCPHCHKAFQGKSQFAGRQILCPGCSKPVTVPSAGAARSGPTPRNSAPVRRWLAFAAVAGLGLAFGSVLWFFGSAERRDTPEVAVAQVAKTSELAPAPRASSPDRATATTKAEPKPTKPTPVVPKDAPKPEPPVVSKPEVPAEPAPVVPKDAPKPEPPAVAEKAPPKEEPQVETYWLGRQPDLAKNVYVFDVRLPADLAAALTCSDPKWEKWRPGVKRFEWEVEDKTCTFVVNPITWANAMIDEGRIAFTRNGGVTQDAWAAVATKSAEWTACKEQLKAQAKVAGAWSRVTPILLKHVSDASPDLTVNFDADRPYDVGRDPITRKPQVVPVVHNNELYVGWHTWGASSPSGKVVVSKVALNRLADGKLTNVRTVPSQGRLVGFAVDATGIDHVLTARAEEFPNNPVGDFVKEVNDTWRPNVLTLHSRGRATDLNSSKFTDLTFYGLTNAGSGRLAAGGDLLTAVFARRHYSPKDGLIHQEANDLILHRSLAVVPLKAGNTVSHSFDQRILFDGVDFVTLNQADAFPYTGLLIEKVRSNPGARPPVARFAAYACPTFGNDVYFELGGLAAEPDGYPVLFTATRNIEAVNATNAAALNHRPWDLALVYVARDFDTRPNPANPYDITGSGILAAGYAPDQNYTVNSFTWNPATSDWTKKDPRTIKRRVLWLTAYDPTTRATHAKFVRLRDGQYVAVWEEHTFADGQWRYAMTRALAIASKGKVAKKTITPGKAVELPGLRLHAGDDAVMLTINRQPHAAWVTAGATNKQLLVHTLDAELTHKAFALKLP